MIKLPNYPKNGHHLEDGKRIKENMFCRLLPYDDFLNYLEKYYKDNESRTIGLMCDYILYLHSKNWNNKIVEFIKVLMTRTIPLSVVQTVLFVTSKIKNDELKEARFEYAMHIKKAFPKVKDIEKIIQNIL